MKRSRRQAVGLLLIVIASTAGAATTATGAIGVDPAMLTPDYWIARTPAPVDAMTSLVHVTAQ